jgi:hypothetical protein
MMASAMGAEPTEIEPKEVVRGAKLRKSQSLATELPYSEGVVRAELEKRWL